MRRLGARGSQTWAAIETMPDGKTRVVVVEKMRRGSAAGDSEIADWIRDARRMATFDHPNLGRVRDVSIRGDEILVTGDYIDGARWSELGSPSARPALETALRVLVDVLSGLSAMHNLRDEKREPVKLVHGDLTPENVIVGLDGFARVVLPCRARGGGQRAERTGSAYLAPEILLGDESTDARADVYGVGAMLWEALSGQALFAGVQPSAIVTQLLSGRVPKATVPAGSPWAAPLVEVVSRAMSADPEKRFASAAAMAAEIRRVAGVKLPPAMRVAGYVRGAHGDRIKARREAIERGEARVAQESDAPPSLDVDVDFDDEGRVTAAPEEPTTTATTRPPPPIEAASPVVIPAPPPVPVVPAASAMAAPPPPAPPRAPPPLPAVEVPPLAPVPADLVREVALERRAAMLEAPPPSPVPAMPPMVTPIDEPVPEAPPRRRKTPVLLIALPVAVASFAAAAVIWWVASREPEKTDATTRPAASTTTAVASAVQSPAAPVPTVGLPAAPSAPTEPAVATPGTPGEIGAVAPSAEPSASTVAAPARVFVAPPVQPARPPPRPRYEPEGI